MLKLEDIRKDAVVNGLEPGVPVRVVTTEPVGENAVTVYFKNDQSLLETNWLTLWVGMKGDAPQATVEFGLQAVPMWAKPTHGELEKVFRDGRYAWREEGAAANDMETRIESFVQSLDSDQ